MSCIYTNLIHEYEVVLTVEPVREKVMESPAAVSKSLASTVKRA